MIDQKQSVLIAADSRDFPFLEKEAAAAGFAPQSFLDSQSALNFFEEHLPQVVVISHDFDQGQGIALCRAIMSLPQGNFSFIVVIGPVNDANAQEVALLSGASWFLSHNLLQASFSAILQRAMTEAEQFKAFSAKEAQFDLCKRELDDLNDQLEFVMGQANQMTQEAQKSYVEINQIFKAVSGGIVLIDLDCNVMRHNEMFLEIVGSTEHIKSKKCFEVFTSSLCHTPGCPVVCIREGQKRVERQITRIQSGKTVHYNLVASPFYGIVGELQGIVVHITDSTRRVEAEEALQESERRYKKLSTVDELTGLFNKRFFNNALHLEISRTARYGQSLSLIMMDIDNFKIHNDTYGHVDGDRVLARLGALLATSLRVNDIACRYGGEEFTVILPATDLAGAAVVAEKIRRFFEEVEFFPVAGVKVNKTVSLGVTQFHDGDNQESLLRRADENLYEAKGQGKNRFIAK